MAKTEWGAKVIKGDRKRINAPPVEYLRSILDYDPATGVMTWRVTRRASKAGSVAGYLENGYCRIRIDGVAYNRSLLAWVHYYGVDTDMVIDHVDLNRANDAIDNLREATFSQNSCNRSKNCDNQSGYKGVSFKAERNKWRASIRARGRGIELGYFNTAEEAAAAYEAAARHLHGDYARVA